MSEEILTLEPLIEAIRVGVEAAGWELSGLQKTTSHQFEGKWEGESTRSAYLFFHLPDGADAVGMDVYLDETGRGLSGNLALVVDLCRFDEVGDIGGLLATLGDASSGLLPARYRRPVTVRLRMADAAEDPGAAETEVRFKVRIPSKTIRAGSEAVTALAGEAMGAFHALLSHQALLTRMSGTEEDPLV